VAQVEGGDGFGRFISNALAQADGLLVCGNAVVVTLLPLNVA
jgi:hypothetical protein